jgi:hypothetical protein
MARKEISRIKSPPAPLTRGAILKQSQPPLNEEMQTRGVSEPVGVKMNPPHATFGTVNFP